LSQDLARAWKAAEHIDLEYGMIGINETSIGSEVPPPLEASSTRDWARSKELSKYGIEEFLSMKYLCFNVGYNKSL
jgi:succinate-semialdehyde dehydrogenase/glutarate-semialdehyde dehydrogenase